jgi:hypothetical protein
MQTGSRGHGFYDTLGEMFGGVMGPAEGIRRVPFAVRA